MDDNVKRVKAALRMAKPADRSMPEFIQDEFGLKYMTFRYRLNNNVLHLEDYHKICALTGRTFDDLFPNPLTPPVRRMNRVDLSNGEKEFAPAIKSNYREVPVFDGSNIHPLINDEIGMMPQVRQQKETSGGLPDVDVYGGLDISEV